jgi:hypothetical protein
VMGNVIFKLRILSKCILSTSLRGCILLAFAIPSCWVGLCCFHKWGGIVGSYITRYSYF